MKEMTERNISEQMKLFELREIIRPDLNIAKWAGFLFSSPWAKDLYEEKKFVFDLPNGAKASITIIPAKNRKRPTTTSLKYFYALLEMWEEQGKRPDGKVFFSGRELAYKTNTPWSGSSTGKRIQENLSVLASSTIDWKRTFYNGSELEVRVDEMHLLDSVSYVGREDMIGSEFFHIQHSARINQDLVFNMINGKTKPFNYKVFISIKNDTAIKLYNLLDNFLSRKNKWERRSYFLLTEDLELTAKRYNELKIRHQRLKEIVGDLNGKEISSGILKLSIQKTADNEDYKLVVEKLPKKPKNKRPKKQANREEDIPFIVDKIIEGLAVSGAVSEKSSGKVLAHLARWYSRDLLLYAVSLVNADFRGNVKTSVIKTYMYQVHVIVHERGMDWIKECGQACKHRPENRKRLPQVLDQTSSVDSSTSENPVNDAAQIESRKQSEAKIIRAAEEAAKQRENDEREDEFKKEKRALVEEFLGSLNEEQQTQVIDEFEESAIFIDSVKGSDSVFSIYSRKNTVGKISSHFCKEFIIKNYLPNEFQAFDTWKKYKKYL